MGTSYTLPADSAGKTLQARITPRSAAPADPAVGSVASSTSVTIAANQTWTGNFTKPDTTGRNWWGADAYCKGLTPAARLPTRAELKNLFVSSTSATAIMQTNYEMCSTHGWPLDGRCGGSTNSYWTSEAYEPYGTNKHYVVYMEDGGAGGTDNAYGNVLVTCVR